MRIDLNCDMGESFGAYTIGSDEAVLASVTSINVACGFHAGDPSVMRRTIRLARAAGVAVGAHPGFNDLWGFGRRVIRMAAGDVERMVAYQIGALQAIAACSGLKVTHMKVHGALSNMAATDREYALAIGRAVKAVDASIIYVAQAATEMERAAVALGCRLAREGFADRQYEDDLTLASRSIAGTVYRDPALAAEQALRLVTERRVIARSAKSVPLEVDTICIHGDEPTGVAVAEAVSKALVAAGVRILPLPEMKLDRG